MTDLADRLEALARQLELPSVVDVSAIIATRARAPHRQRFRVVRFAMLPIVAIAAVLVLPEPRGTLARWFGLTSTRIERPPATSANDTGVIATPPTFPSTTFPIGIDVTTAESEVGLPAPISELLGPPLGVSVIHPPNGGQIVLEYAPSSLLPESPIPGVGALVSVFRADLDGGIFQKTLGPGTTLEEVQVHGTTGYWLAGAPHEYGYVTPDGQFTLDSLRLATNTLIWEVDGVTYRVEALVDKATALRIAESIRN